MILVHLTMPYQRQSFHSFECYKKMVMNDKRVKILEGDVLASFEGSAVSQFAWKDFEKLNTCSQDRLYLGLESNLVLLDGTRFQ
jgi:hypothetical protein